MNKKKQFSKIYDQYLDKIYRFIFFKVNSKEEAEDLTSEVFLRTWHAFQNSEIKDFRAFLYQTARNLVTDYYRKKSKENPLSLENLPQIEDKNSLQEKIEKNFDFNFVWEKMKNLREDYQEALFLRYVDGYSIKEIAQILGKTPDNTKVLLHRALLALKKECNQNPSFPSS